MPYIRNTLNGIEVVYPNKRFEQTEFETKIPF
jgi:hypothetical protein